VCAVKALGGSWRQKSSHSNDSQHRRTGGGTGKSKKGGPKLTCAKPGCKSHLSKGIQKRAEQWAEDRPAHLIRTVILHNSYAGHAGRLPGRTAVRSYDQFYL
jgi:hypothetical protein